MPEIIKTKGLNFIRFTRLIHKNKYSKTKSKQELLKLLNDYKEISFKIWLSRMIVE